MSARRVLVSWSSGKDSAWALHELRREPEHELVGLLTSVNEAVDRVAMHGVRRTLLDAQAAALGLPLWVVRLPWPCPNAVYEERHAAALARARQEGVTHVAFGDLFLEDVRAYRIRQLQGTGIEPLFPLWQPPDGTRGLAERMLAAGLRAVLSCVDLKRLPAHFTGRAYDARLLADLPADVDPCGERGEFHTFCTAGPMFREALRVRVGERVVRDGFAFADLEPVEALHS